MSSTTAAPAQIGVGLGYRGALRQDILRNVGEIDFLEIVTDSFFRNEKGLHALSTLRPCLPHSLNLSVGSTINEEYLARVARTVELVRPPWHSDHLAFTREGELSVGHLAPVPYTQESLDVVVANVQRVQDAIRVPFALENITMPFYWPDNTMTEDDFLCQLVKRTGCWLLLDLENVRVNHANHGRDGRAFLDALPLERVLQVHVAGGVHGDGVEHDSHSAPVSAETWSLLNYLCDIAPPPGILLERDSNFPPFAEILSEIRHAKAILTRKAAA